MAALEALQQDAMTAFKALGVVEDDGDNPSKTTITVKSLPPQTKRAVVGAGLKSGLVLKRDEAAAWKPRLAVVRVGLSGEGIDKRLELVDVRLLA